MVALILSWNGWNQDCRLTSSTIQDEIPKPRPTETAVSAGERSETFFEGIGPGTDCPVYQTVYRVRSEIGGKLTSIKQVGTRSAGCDLGGQLGSRCKQSVSIWERSGAKDNDPRKRNQRKAKKVKRAEHEP